MKKSLMTTCLLASTFLPVTGFAAEHVHHYRNRSYRAYKHHQHVKTAKRVGVGAVGGAVVGGLLGGGKGAAIGAAAGGGTGYLYDKHKKHEGQ